MNSSKIIALLQPFVTENKRLLIDQVLSKRTRHFTLVFEDINIPHNVSAVLRTAECMGIQDLHFIKNKNSYAVNKRITKGAAKWVSMHHYKAAKNNIDACYSHLKTNGYTIFATSLHESAVSIYDLDSSQKSALVFGTEARGISEEAGQKADGYVYIPMDGFTESFNLSVSAAICLTVLRSRYDSWPPLEEEEKQALKAEWYRKIVKGADKILIHQSPMS